MRIYRFWNCRKEEINGLTVHFKAGSNDSPEAAAALTEEKIAIYRQYALSGAPDARAAAELKRKLWQGNKEKYETPICEEITQSIDSRNIITRNRYGALVLNSEDHAFLDIDLDTPLPFAGIKTFLLQLIGKLPKKSRAQQLEELIRQVINSRFPYTPFRLYRTANGFRLLTPAKGEANSRLMEEMMQYFRCDPLYMTLCARQNCFRARLTPKPRRMGMKTALKFRFPFCEEEKNERKKWLTEYNTRSENYKTCTLAAVFGADLNTPVVKIHDELCKCGSDLPLA